MLSHLELCLQASVRYNHTSTVVVVNPGMGPAHESGGHECAKYGPYVGHSGRRSLLHLLPATKNRVQEYVRASEPSENLYTTIRKVYPAYKNNSRALRCP